MHEPVTGNGVRRYGPVRAGPEENHKSYQGAANLFCGKKKKAERDGVSRLRGFSRETLSGSFNT